MSDSTAPLWPAGLSEISVYTVLPRLDHLSEPTPKASPKRRSAPSRGSKDRKTKPTAPKRTQRSEPVSKRESEV